MPQGNRQAFGWSSRLLEGMMSGPLPALLMLMAIAVGLVALWITPREEEPQIIVPLADVLVWAPGLSAQQVERQVTTPLEKLLYQIDGVEYVYSMSQSGRSVVTVRFYVGESREDSLESTTRRLCLCRYRRSATGSRSPGCGCRYEYRATAAPAP